MRTIDSHFGLSAAPADQFIKLTPKDRRLSLDILSITGGTIRAILMEAIPSQKEIAILSIDDDVVDTFTPGRMIRGGQSAKMATVTGSRSSGNLRYLSVTDTGPSKFFTGETISEVGLTGTDIAALAVVDSLPVQKYLLGEQVSSTAHVSADVVVDIAAATAADPNPNRPRIVRLAYAFASAPTNVSWVLRVS